MTYFHKTVVVTVRVAQYLCETDAALPVGASCRRLRALSTRPRDQVEEKSSERRRGQVAPRASSVARHLWLSSLDFRASFLYGGDRRLDRRSKLLEFHVPILLLLAFRPRHRPQGTLGAT